MLKVYSGTIRSKTAGLSPYNDERIELFLAGCRMAREGHPCPGCFNSDLWYDDNCHEQTAEEIVSYIESMTDNKYITIVGGEPLDQAKELVLLLKTLQEKHFHVVLISHYRVDEILKMEYGKNILSYTNLLIDGRYEADKRIFETDTRPGIYHVVGSSNQRLWYNIGKGYIDITGQEDLRKFYTKRGEGI